LKDHALSAHAASAVNCAISHGIFRLVTVQPVGEYFPMAASVAHCGLPAKAR
jgi:hypothetical protein